VQTTRSQSGPTADIDNAGLASSKQDIDQPAKQPKSATKCWLGHLSLGGQETAQEQSANAAVDSQSLKEFSCRRLPRYTVL
jgi:hypothetical protein